MPSAALLLREATPPSLSTLVARSQHLPPPHPAYDLHLSPTHFSLTPFPETPDEGFESDTNSIVSNGSYETKTAETDSANGSASSDSDTDTPEITRRRSAVGESFNLVDCVCYNDVTYPDVLLFVIKNEALVFKFADLTTLRNFYVNFTAVKAVTNQKVVNKNCKFNLLQRTDGNGVTHIEITRESEPILAASRTGETTLRKVWSSADDLLRDTVPRTNHSELRTSTAPKRPERRKKSKAPPPPPQATPPPSPDVLRGEYVRVNVNIADAISKDFIAKSQLVEKKPIKSNLVALLISKPAKVEAQWTGSVPRLLKKQRSRSETRCFTPMAYRYIDTAPTYSPMGERLFGLSSKLKDFGEGRECRWNSGGDLSYKEGNLKSMIKKDEGRKKNEKKVTFSAYTTVQVV